MPQPELANRTQRAVLWPMLGYDAYGQATVGPPVEILVRWDTKRRETLDREGNSIALDATAVVDRRIDIGSRMWLGPISEWLGTGSLEEDTHSGVMEVRSYSETPDIKGRFTFRVVGLMRLHDT
jgi:hypothetical protein